MLNYNEITQKKYVEIDGEPFEVISSHVFRKQQRKPVNQTKLKNLITGKVTERSFHQAEKVNEANIDTRKIKFLYANKGEQWFCEENTPSKRFSMPDTTENATIRNFVKENSIIDAIVFSGNIIGIRPPIKVDLAVTEAPPAVKGNTAQGGTKQITLETGVTVNAPLFINEGDIVRVNTETGEYTERVEKK
ncbi:MAG: elongation factor P [Candidatus Yonathbacteria bacterium CG_4_10_14_3_um_filter_47_65]|uniref:Elongation factor P n=2 Tax=Parcubacteria group TaxID=1794811 RepID=A0A2M8D7F5_9BACT|nr:MAG: hypothetical protein AUJ44_01860 [Candidatus Nomurabacteria bacterium CG1_02_47_685]PIP04152.1 MAG: elongation factor P [Candidatus Yonathbacteria bacterium CG23_combo_of_CG06-09_8_20_14_all_46_18]PIQ31817.1 MAG: elongation factor P [Candidatus Yonathbacteria bacterium CG17_big_fil_post_rev_8_21_14_2_50_46_19]PIX56761.1 MAG: elongation factor P [Candidatus Yonathbacteria bacterium CG_4_10_14_3_um_filter_47_65]PIY57595.1 MAG: elongation factor P [Candidatus Yonathbacteria bacterium CG_4_